MLQNDSIATNETAPTAEPTCARPEIGQRRRRQDSGAMLLAVLFMMAMMIIVALAVAPSLIQQAKRDREEEMIHRGTEYARAIKKYYKKFGRYPANLEQLDNTNQIRFLRRQFKDPLTKNGNWKLLHYGDIASIAGAMMLGPQAGVQGGVQAGRFQGGLSQSPNQSNGASGDDQGANTAPAGAQLGQQQPGMGVANQTASGAQTGTGDSSFGSGSSGAPAQAGAGSATNASPGGDTSGTQNQGAQNQGAQNQGAQSQGGSNNSIFGNSGVGGQTFGGGAIVGVASLSSDQTIRIYNKKKKYDEWVFIYSPMMDIGNTLLRGPYNGQTFTNAQIGTPAGQMNNPGGQQPGGFGQPFTMQNQQQLTPGTQYPPDQTQPQTQPPPPQ